MDEDPNPVKEYLFDKIKISEKKYQQLFLQTKMKEIIDDILKNCYDKVSLVGKKEESLGILATGILHYMLTNAQITSQRKIEFQNVEIDIVIPDLMTLKKDPKKTLVIYISKTSDKRVIEQKLEELEKIQPEKQNIWIVLNQDIESSYTKYLILKENSSFSKIIYDISQFANVQGHTKFKILRV